VINYETSDDLLELFQNKRVAIVGPSPHLIGTNMGNLIDSHDLVCRINEIHPTGYEKDYGNRTDVVFHNCGAAFVGFFGEQIQKKSIISKNLKFVICPSVKSQGTDNDWANWPKNKQSDVVNNFKRINIFNTPFCWIGLENYRKVYDLFGTEPNAGQTSIIIALEHAVKQLLVTGFSFYQQGDMPEQSHRPGHTQRGLENSPCGNSSHRQDPQIKTFTQKILKKYGHKIVIDSKLDNILKCNHSNVINLNENKDRI
tara:strand:+ start:1584 stop:2351 length:768 start_codon:yes stop_codon:yes gene_type:complete